MSVIRWEEPPSNLRGGYRDWAGIGAALKAQPDEWALVLVCETRDIAGSTARFIREGKYLDLRSLGRFEAKSRTADGEFRVYARYVGEPS